MSLITGYKLPTYPEGPPAPPTPLPPPPIIYPPTYPAPEPTPQPEDTVLKAMLKQLAGWIIDEIVRPAIEGAIWLIDWIRAELRYWTYRFQEYLVDVTSTTEGLIATLALVLAAAVLLPQMVDFFVTSSVGVFVGKVIEWTKERVGRILEAIHFIDLMAVHEMLLVLWPTWREIFVPFQDAISALAEQLGQGTGYIHSWLSVAHGLSMVGTSMLNLDPKIGEIRAVESSQEFMGRLDERLRAYQHDPGLILRDIVEELYLPYATDIRDTHTATVDSIRDVRGYFLDLDQSLQALDTSFENLINATLPEFQDRMRDNLSGIRAEIERVSTWIEVKLLPPIDTAIRVLAERAKYLEQANEVARRKFANPIEIFMATEFQDQATQLETFHYIEQMVLAAGEGGQEGFTEIGGQARDYEIEATGKVIMETVAPPYMMLEAPIGALPPAEGPSRIKKWNVGEY